MKRKLDQQDILSSPTRHYIVQLAETSERMQAQLAITKEELKDRDALLMGRKRQKMGKWFAVTGKLVFTTEEIRDRVKSAEAEAAAAKKKKKKGKTPVEPIGLVESELEGE